MNKELLGVLRCPVSREHLELEVISYGTKNYNGKDTEVIWNGLLKSSDFIYPVIEGIPRLTVEAFLDYEVFLKEHAADYESIKRHILDKHAGLISFVLKKNKRSKQSFSQEWGIFNYEEDKVWDVGGPELLVRFLKENDETKESIAGKVILDAGCGNGLLNQSIAACGARVIGMDFSQSVVRAFQKNSNPNALFIQGDVQFPPFAFEYFDIVHSSGVIICTNNSELSFSCLEACVKKGGKISVWLYHPSKDGIHNLFNFLRNYTSKLPVKFQYYLYSVTLLPISYVVKRAKGNKQNKREMMIDILDWFSPEFRWEHRHDEAAAWFYKRNYGGVKVTTTDSFGFNIIGVKNI
jgi:2-polyprenyl-3-methyl-5-hydroxy-6-metoxy-1,4-benzoquinol methylase/uncharacterized protein YbaR (Trm112 family)